MSVVKRHRSGQPRSQPANQRRMRGFESVAHLTEGAIRDAAGQRGFAIARLLTHWPEIVGEELAALCRPVRMSHGRSFGATLVLLTTGPYAPMLEMRLPQLRDKVNACFGYNAVARISITQTAATGFAEGQASFAHAPATARAQPAPPAPPSPEIQRAAKAAVAEIRDPHMRSSLEKLATLILSRSDPDVKK